MKKTFIILLTLTLWLSASAEPLSADSPSLRPELAEMYYMNKTYLKNADKRIAKLQKKIKLAEKKKLDKKKDLLLTELTKIAWWEKYYTHTEELFTVKKERVGDWMGKGSETMAKRDALLQKYEKLCGTKFPRSYYAGVSAVLKNLASKAKKKK